MLKHRAELLRCFPHHYHSLAEADGFEHIKRIAECLHKITPLLCVLIHLWYSNENVICSRSDSLAGKAKLCK